MRLLVRKRKGVRGYGGMVREHDKKIMWLGGMQNAKWQTERRLKAEARGRGGEAEGQWWEKVSRQRTRKLPYTSDWGVSPSPELSSHRGSSETDVDVATPRGRGPGLLLPQSSLMSKKAKNSLWAFTAVRARGPVVKAIEDLVSHSRQGHCSLWRSKGALSLPLC